MRSIGTGMPLRVFDFRVVFAKNRPARKARLDKSRRGFAARALFRTTL